jgi:hypothetical protein
MLILAWISAVVAAVNCRLAFVNALCGPTAAFRRDITRRCDSNQPLLRILNTRKSRALVRCSSTIAGASSSQQQEEENLPWKGDVVVGSKIKGCTIQPVPKDGIDSTISGMPLEWIVTIDGIDADLGRFSDAIYRKLIGDAKNQRFQGFRPGTIPPMLLGTYKAYAMDECARETVLEALQQNNIRPFESTRADCTLEQFSIPPPEKSSGVKKTGKKKSGRKNKASVSQKTSQDALMLGEPSTDVMVDAPRWQVFDSMKEAIDGGWQPGQSFSFVAKNVKGQKVKDASETEKASPLGIRF